MTMTITIAKPKIKFESIIEYKLTENSLDFYYSKNSGAIFIHSAESAWIWTEKSIKINASLYYDCDKYNLFLYSPKVKKFDISCIDKYSNYNVEHITLVNSGILPRHINKKDLIAIGFLIPKIESHVIEIKEETQGE